MTFCNLSIVLALLLAALSAFAENNPPREKLLMDFGWRFAFGHANDPAKDFDPALAGEMLNYLTSPVTLTIPSQPITPHPAIAGR